MPRIIDKGIWLHPLPEFRATDEAVAIRLIILREPKFISGRLLGHLPSSRAAVRRLTTRCQNRHSSRNSLNSLTAAGVIPTYRHPALNKQLRLSEMIKIHEGGNRRNPSSHIAIWHLLTGSSRNFFNSLAHFPWVSRPPFCLRLVHPQSFLRCSLICVFPY